MTCSSVRGLEPASAFVCADPAGGATKTEPIAQRRVKESLRIEGTTTPGQRIPPMIENHSIEIRYYDEGRRNRYPLPVSKHPREIFAGLIRIHVLLHAAHEPLFGLAMMEELAHH